MDDGSKKQEVYAIWAQRCFEKMDTSTPHAK